MGFIKNMAGHSKWKKIKHKKAIEDSKRSRVFSKLLKVISVAAREGPNPDFNPRLKAAIETAKAANIPKENIEKAIRKTSEYSSLEEIVMEAYGPGGTALIIEVLADNKNRAVQEIKGILKENWSRLAEPGSVVWAYEKIAEKDIWRPKFPQEIDGENKEKLQRLMGELEISENVQNIYHNAVI